MATPLPLIPGAASSPSVAPPIDDSGAAVKSPILMFLYFHKAIRLELDCLHKAAVEFATCGDGDIWSIKEKCIFLAEVYKHHCNAEDAVIFPALDIRVKNIAHTYSLEHKGESALFDQLFNVLGLNVQNNSKYRRELASCTGTIQTLLNQHMYKEEEQVFPLIIKKFSVKEQADLVWQLLCSIPVNMMEKLLPWLSSCVVHDDHQDMIECLCQIVPEEKLLQQVIFSWVERRHHLSSSEKKICLERSTSGKRKYRDMEGNNVGFAEVHPINEILCWHGALKSELIDIAEEAKKLKLSGVFADFSAFNARLHFIADVCIFHSIAEDLVIFPEVDGVVFLEHKHTEEEKHFSKLRRLIEEIQNALVNCASVDFCSKLSIHADQIIDTILNHFEHEEAVVLPFARQHFSQKKQRELLYKSLCVMPLSLLEHVLPWLAAKLSEGETQFFLQNLHMAAPSSDASLVKLLSGWTCKGRIQNLSCSHNFTCMSPKGAGNCLFKEETAIEDFSTKCACSSTIDTEIGSSNTKISYNKKHGKQGNLSILPRSNKSCCVPSLGFCSSNFGINSWRPIKSLHTISYLPSAPYFNSSLFFNKMDIMSSRRGNKVRPIDNIFKFHKAISKDLEFLDIESGNLLDCDRTFIRLFSGRFQLLWGLYRAHSNAEDDTVFPALESKETLLNVSHSYTLDHKQEEKLFSDMSLVLLELSQLHILKPDDTYQITWKQKHNKLATKLQNMCKSLRVALEHHVYREELELWPLFDKHFSVEEQDKIVGKIIGTTGAEVLQTMLPWVTSALTIEEQNEMMDAWKQATKNTMFDEWLSEWWKDSPNLQAEAESSAISQEMDYQKSIEKSDELFKLGWENIFRMNENELESEIRKVSRHPTLDPRRKDYLIQHLMTSRWVAAQQNLPEVKPENDAGGANVGCSPSFRDPENQVFGCEHYKRNCKLLAACCGKLFTCRFCHDKVSDHSMDRKSTSEMMCMQCTKVQPVGPFCSTISCNGFSMAKYYCNICKFFDDERNVYHCPSCNLCRVGKGLGIDFFHCMKCNCCMGMKLADHKCREKGLESNCPICCEFLFTSSETIKPLPCGHYMHSACFQAYTCSHYTCPICSKSLVDATVYFGMLDALLAAETLPEEYRHKVQEILCHDCEKKGTCGFHWLYHKCVFCGSYNTRVISTNQCTSSHQQ